MTHSHRPNQESRWNANHGEPTKETQSLEQDQRHRERRIVILAGIFGVLTFVILFCKLWQLR